MRFPASLVTILVALAALTVSASSRADPILRRGPLYRRASITDACDIGFCTLNGGTTGGAAAEEVTTVTTLYELQVAASLAGPAIILIEGAITGSATVSVSSNKTILGAPESQLNGIGLTLKNAQNIILRNLNITSVVAANGDAITINSARNIWVDHCDLSSDVFNGKDFYDGLLDVTHAGAYVTVSHTYLHDHFKASLVGHSDGNGGEDRGKLQVTYVGNMWYNINSRGPSMRFGTGHVVNSFYLSCNGAINTRMGAQLLVQSTKFENCGTEVIESIDSSTNGFAVVEDVDLGGSLDVAPQGTIAAADLGYNITLIGSEDVKGWVIENVGTILTFE